MDRLKLWIADEDGNYTELLKRYIQFSEFQHKLSVFAYSEINCFVESIHLIGKDDILLVTPSFISYCDQLLETTLIELTEDSEIRDSGSYYQIYKYRPLNQFMIQLMNIHHEKNEKANGLHTELKSKRSIAVYSASGGSGVSTLANQLSEYFVNFDQKVLCLNMEHIHSLHRVNPFQTTSRFSIKI